MRCLVLWIVISFNCIAESTLPKTVHFGLPVNDFSPDIMYPPKNYGIALEIVIMVAEQLNIELLFYKAPEKRLQYSLKNNYIDALFKSQAWVSNKSDYYWSEPIVIMKNLFISYNKIAYEFSTFEILHLLLLIHILVIAILS